MSECCHKGIVSSLLSSLQDLLLTEYALASLFVHVTPRFSSLTFFLPQSSSSFECKQSQVMKLKVENAVTL